MSEHRIHGDLHPGNEHSGGSYPGGPHHGKPAEKHAAAATTQVNRYSKNACRVKALVVHCEHHEKGMRTAAPEEEAKPKEGHKPMESHPPAGNHNPGEKHKPDGKSEIEQKVLVLSVIPHGVADKRTGTGLTTTGQPLTDHAQDKYYEQGEKKLNGQRDDADKTHLRAQQARAEGHFGPLSRAYAGHLDRQAQRKDAAYGRDKAKFMKTYGDHVHGDAELYLNQGDPRVDDVVTLKADMISHCGKHPIWKIWDCFTNKWVAPSDKGHEMEFVGLELPMRAFPPPVIPANYLQPHSILPAWVPGEKAYWLKGIEPRRYKIHFLTCDPEYTHSVIHLNVYPLIESGIQVSISRETGKVAPKPGSWSAAMHKYQDEFEQALHTLDHIAPGGKVECEVLPEGSFTLANEWKEEPASHEVVWSGSIKAAVTLFDLYGEKNILDALPGFISDFIRKVTDFGVTLRAGVKPELEGAAEWKQAPEAAKATVSGSIALKGSFYASVTLVVMLRHANEDKLGARASGLTTAVVKGELGFEPEGGHMHLPLEVTVQWEKPLDISFLLVFIWKKKSYTYSFLKGYLHPITVCRVDLMGKKQE